MRIFGLALAATLLIGSAGWCGEGSKQEKGSPSKAPVLIDISKWPLYPGAELTNQVDMTSDILKEMIKSAGSEVPANVLNSVKGLFGVAIRGYKLPKDAPQKKVLEFYESRILAAGFKPLVRNFEKGEASGVYLSGSSGVIVVNVENEDPEDGNNVEIVAVTGDLKSLAKLKDLEKLEKAVHKKKEAPKAEEPPIPDNDKA